MNMSFREIYLWLTQVDLPSLATLWNWLINVPWWLSLGTVLFVYFTGRLLFELIWTLYLAACDKAGDLGRKMGKGTHIMKDYVSRIGTARKAFKARLRILFGFDSPL